MLSHRNLLANALHNLVATGHTASDRWLHVCPMFHVAGTSNVFACTWVGATQVILPRFDPARRAGDDRARADHPRRVRPDDAGDAARGRRGRRPLARCATSSTRRRRSRPSSSGACSSGFRVRRRAVLRHDRGGADRHPPLRRRPPRAPGPARPRWARRCPACRSRCATRCGERRRALGARPERDARLLEPARGDGRGARRRLVPHRRPRARRRGRLPLHGRPRQGHDHHRRRERVLGRGRERR